MHTRDCGVIIQPHNRKGEKNDLLWALKLNWLLTSVPDEIVMAI